MNIVWIVIDEAAPGSLKLVMDLNRAGTCQNLGDGVYEVKGDPKQIERLAESYPDVVLKVEAANAV